MTRALAIFILPLATAHCANTATFTTARALPAGTVQHTLGFEFGATRFAREGRIPTGEARADSFVVQYTPSYGVRGGLSNRVELGGKLAVGTVELNSKFQFFASRHVAVAVAPRVTSIGLIPFSTPYLFRAPILLSLQSNHWFSWTVRVGPAAAAGKVTYLFEGPITLHDFLVEAGSVWMVHVTPSTWLAFEGSFLATPASERVFAPSFGIGLLMGPSLTQESRYP